MKCIVFSAACMLALFIANAQPIQPFIKLSKPAKESNATVYARQFIAGATCVGCSVTINDTPIMVYATGAFVYELNLVPGDTTFTIKAKSSSKDITKKISFSYTLPTPPEPVKTLTMESLQSFPEGDLLLQPGDKINFKVKTLPNAQVQTYKNTQLYEMPLTETKGMAGIYQGTYTLQASDTFTNTKFNISVRDSAGNTTSRQTKAAFSVMSSSAPDIAITKGRLAHLEYGLGDDRLGGAKVGYIDSNIVLKIIGKVGTHYKVQLAKSRIAYIPDELVTIMPKGSFAPSSLTDKITVWGDSVYDYVRLGMFTRLPYQTFQKTDPTTIVVDVFGATNNTNWITQLQSATEIKQVDYEQLQDDIYRITIRLKHTQPWGHLVYYSGNNLIVKIKHQPQSLSLKNLVIAVDAGHGGTNTGGAGLTGTIEKDLTLAVSLKLQKALEKEGAKVIMTRTKETFFDNKERILFYRDSTPDLLLSIHLNSSDDPIHSGGVSTYYRYIGFKNLSVDLYKRLLELGLKDYGNTGSFNFMLNSPTEYPNALLELLFLSNPEEEMKIIDPDFQQKTVDKIILGLKDFLERCKKN